MLTGQNRLYYARNSKPRDVYRVAFMGDSMTYGQGVNPKETLPAQFERIINKSVWPLDIEVINFGLSGGSIYDSWELLQCRAVNYDADLVILVLCDNDAEFTSAQGGEYGDHVRACWSEDGLYRAYMERIIERMGEYQRTTPNLQIAIAFYYIWDHTDTIMLIKRALGEMTSRSGIHYVDLSETFVGEHCASRNKSMFVSKMDGHPSALAHSLAASALARHVIKEKLIPEGERSCSEAEIVEKLCANALDMAALGYRPEHSLVRLSSILEAKHRSPKREAFSKKDQLDEHAYDALQSAIRSERAALCRRLQAEGYLSWLKMGYPSFSAQIENGVGQLRNAFKHVFPICENLRDSRLKYHPYHDEEVDGTAASEGVEGLVHGVQVLERGIELAATRVRTLFPAKNEFIEKRIFPASDLPDYLTQALHEYINETEWLIRGFGRLIRELQGALKSLGKAAVLNETTRDVQGAIQELNRILRFQAQILKNLGFNRIMNIDESAISEPYVTINCEATCGNRGPAILLIKTTASVPDLGTTVQMDYMSSGGTRHIYRHQFPLFSLGAVEVKAYDCAHSNRPPDSFVLHRIEIAANPAKAIVLNDPPQAAGASPDGLPTFLFHLLLPF